MKKRFSRTKETIRTTISFDIKIFKCYRESEKTLEPESDNETEKSKNKSRLVSGIVAIAALFRAIPLLYTVANWWDIAESVCDVFLILLS